MSSAIRLVPPYSSGPEAREPCHITGRTRVFPIIGDPVAGVRTPEVFNPLFAHHQRDAVCIPMQVPALELDGFFRGIRAAQNVDGLFVTTPHKSRMLDLLDDADPSARSVGAVNVARREAGGRWRGAMFDGYGCILGMLWLGVDPKGRNSLLIGAGGAGRAIAFALVEAGVTRLVIADRDERRASSLVGALRSAAPLCDVRPGPADAHGFDLIINASPLGMLPEDPSPVDMGRLDATATVVDITLGAAPSALLTAAAGRGCQVQDGRALHDGQAIYAARFFGIDYWPHSRPRITLPLIPPSLTA